MHANNLLLDPPVKAAPRFERKAMPDKTTLRNEEIFRYWSEYARTVEDIASRFNLTRERGRQIGESGGGKSALPGTKGPRRYGGPGRSSLLWIGLCFRSVIKLS